MSAVVPIAVSLSGGPFCGATGMVALQPKEMDVYLIQDVATRLVHAYRWADRTEQVEGVAVGWVLEYVCAVGSPAASATGAPALPGVAQFLESECNSGEVQP